jgi:glyoxylase-like metal-dependent hydrolase (beta-lactamase superfamily II)
VLIRTVAAPLLGANCHVVPDGDGCVVVDPGGGVAGQVREAVATAGLIPHAILLTHGHLDHTWSAAELSEEWAVPVLVHEDDAYRLADPVGTLGPLGTQLAAMAGVPAGPPVPTRLETFRADADTPHVVVGQVSALHAPGHTEGSTVYLVDGGGEGTVALTGDVLFAGTIGRCDLPGGDERAMAATLRRLARLDVTTRVLPGHGPWTTIGDELASNPYLTASR